MPAASKNTLIEVTALASNVGSSVLLIYSNKYLMSHKAGLGFSFGQLFFFDLFDTPTQLRESLEK